MNDRCKPILLVEDNPDHAELTMDAIKQSKVHNEIIWVTDGAAALDYLHRRGAYADRTTDEPALVLLDIKLPGMDGLEILRLIRSDPNFDAVPVVMLTTSAQEAEVLKAYSSHANSYVVKPMNFDQFYQRVQDLNIYWTLTNYLPSQCLGGRNPDENAGCRGGE